jgi:hypothetical protein
LQIRYEFEAPKGGRFFRYGCGVTVIDKQEPFWWDKEARRWIYFDPNKSLSTHAPCRTFKAFKRHVRKHYEELKGREVIWANRFYNITAFVE